MGIARAHQLNQDDDSARDALENALHTAPEDEHELLQEIRDRLAALD